jgi:hypothetical protein
MANDSNQAPAWPKHPDGRPMRMGEMSREQQLEQARYACKQLQPELERVIRRVMQDSNEGV